MNTLILPLFRHDKTYSLTILSPRNIEGKVFSSALFVVINPLSP
ncbi:hypothetical protein SAMN02745746_00722 [Pseudogulbenkiania subflava DSM 22618]|uniref:Uncharacterized protein n=1 Tax=Pseudogulbenkiania subflava DSM 22618 TaxID=1123014 RepID=A0A1Y6BCZ7_9NEIS|nr:hypothetical protein SAMN02745746_00722 [Pseudogulbenkiania subflava DSM 22618]